MIKKIMIIALAITLITQANHIPAVTTSNRIEIMEEGGEEPPPERV